MYAGNIGWQFTQDSVDEAGFPRGEVSLGLPDCVIDNFWLLLRFVQPHCLNQFKSAQLQERAQAGAGGTSDVETQKMVDQTQVADEAQKKELTTTAFFRP